MTKTQTKKRLFYIDLLNCIAIFGVLIQHTAQIAHVGPANSSITIVGKVIQTIFLPAVGIFFMNSGAMLLDYRKRQSTEHFAKRRFLRVVVPFLLWSVFYYVYGYYYYTFPGIFHHSIFGLRNFAEAFLGNKINSLFWFFFIIIQLYIATPVFSLLSQKYKKILLFIVIVAFVSSDVFSYLGNILHLNLEQSMLTQPLLASSWIQYFILGYLFKEKYFSKTFENGIITFGLITFVMNIANDVTGGHHLFLQDISNFPYTIAVYLLIKRLAEQNDNVRVANIVAKFASTSLGIYILHPILIALFDWLLFGQTSERWTKYLTVLENPIHIFVFPIIIYILLVPLIYWFKKLPLSKYILP